MITLADVWRVVRLCLLVVLVWAAGVSLASVWLGRVHLSWGDGLSEADRAAGWVTEIYRSDSPNGPFVPLAVVPGSAVVLRSVGPAGFFIVRHVHTNSGFATGWNIKK